MRTRIARVTAVSVALLVFAMGSPASAVTIQPYTTVAVGTITAAKTAGTETGPPLGAGSFSGFENYVVVGACTGGVVVQVIETLTHTAATGDRVFGTAVVTGCFAPSRPLTFLTGSETFTGGTGAFVGAAGRVSVIEIRSATAIVAQRTGAIRLP
jgi:hypothetical protein